MPRRSYSRSRSYDRKERDNSRGGYRGKQVSRSRSPPRSGYRGGGGPQLNAESQVYVARFSKRTSEHELRKAFERYGYIEKVDIKEFRGFGFIYFENRRDAEDAIEDMNGRSLPNADERLVVEKAGGGRRGRGGARGRRSRSREHPLSRVPRGSDTACYNCNKEGHFARECRESPQASRPGGPKGQDGRCFICDEKGHKKIDCPERRGNYRGGGGGYKHRDQSVSRDSRSPKRSRSRSNSRKGRKYRDESRSPKRKSFRKQSYSKSRSPRHVKKYKSKGRADRSVSPKRGGRSPSRSRSRSPRDSKNGSRHRSVSNDSKRRPSKSLSKTQDKHRNSLEKSQGDIPTNEVNGEETDATAITQLQSGKNVNEVSTNEGMAQ